MDDYLNQATLGNDEGSLTANEYNLILKFLYEYKIKSNQGDPMHQLLMCLAKYFSCSCASLWCVDSAMHMQNPIAWNINPQLLADYEDKYQYIDEYHVRNADCEGEQVASVFEYTDEMRHPSEYLERLKNEKISHRYAVLLRDEGRLKGTLALFKPLDDPSGVPTRCLEVLAPFITQEFLNAQRIGMLERSETIMRSILNTAEMGIALFESYNTHDIYYYNTACVNYCSKFCKGQTEQGVIKSFIESLVLKLGDLWYMMKDTSIEYSVTENGKELKYSVRLVENVEGQEGVSSLFITPLNAISNNDIPYTDLFSQLTGREKEITILVAKGYTNQDIAEKLFISLPTVKTHIRHIFEKANVSNRTSLLAMMSGTSEEANT